MSIMANITTKTTGSLVVTFQYPVYNAWPVRSRQGCDSKDLVGFLGVGYKDNVEEMLIVIFVFCVRAGFFGL